MSVTVEELQILVTADVSKAASEINSFMSKITGMVNNATKPVTSTMSKIGNAVSGVTKPITNQTKTISKSMDAVAAATAKATSTGTKDIDGMIHTLDNLNAQIRVQEQLLSQMQGKYANVSMLKGGDSAEALKLESQILKTEGTIDRMIHKSDLMADAIARAEEPARAVADGMKAAADSTDQATASAGGFRAVFEKITAPISDAQSKISGFFSMLTSAGSKVSNVAFLGLPSLFHRIRDGADQSNKSLMDMIPTANGIVGAFTKVGNVFKLMVLRMAIRAVIQSVMQSFKDLASYSNEFNSTMSNLNSSLQYAGRSIATALAPALQALTPVITWLIDGFANLMNIIGAFTAKLFGGSNTYVKAKKTQTNFAASTKKTTGAIKEQKKALDSQLASFDELNVIKHDDTGGGSGGGGGADMGAPAVGDMFETVQVPEGVSKFVDKLRSVFDGTKTVVQDFIKKLNPTWQAFADGFERLKQPAANFATSVGQSFSRLKTEFIQPALSYYLGEYLPTMTNATMTTFVPIFTDIMAVALQIWADNFAWAVGMIIQIWNDILYPILERIKQTWVDLMAIIKSLWDEYGASILEGVQGFFASINELFTKFYNAVIQPIIENALKMWDWLWNEHLKGLIEQVGHFIMKLVDGALQIWNKFIAPIVGFLIDTLGPVFANTFSFIGDVIGTVIGVIADVASGIFKALGGIIDFITGVFTGNWEKAWNGIKNIFGGIVDGIKGIFKGAINIIIDALNFFIRGANKLKINVPDWVPGIGGKNFGFNIPEIPKLAAGGVVTSSTLVNVGEYAGARSNPEIIAPQSIMQETFAGSIMPMIDALFEVAGMIIQAIDEKDMDVNLDGETLAQKMHRHLKKQDRLTGGSFVMGG